MTCNGRRGAWRARLLAVAVTLLVVGLPGSSVAAPAWLVPRNLSDAGESAGNPSIALDRAGDAVAVWAGSSGSSWRVRVRERRAGGEWRAARNLSADVLETRGPQVAVNAAGDAVAVWAEATDVGWVVRASGRSAGRKWTAPQALAVRAEDVGGVRVALDRRGTAVAVWDRRRYDGSGGIVQAAVRAAHGAWGDSRTLSTAGANAGGPDVALDARGNAVAAWVQDVNGSAGGVVHAARRPAGAGWSTPRRLSSTEQAAYIPRLAVDRDGNAVVVWSGNDGAVRVARRPVGGRWGTPHVLATGPNATNPAVAVDPAGEVVVVWEADYARVRASTRSRSGSWSAPRTLSPAGRTAAFPEVALGAAGDAVAVWISFNARREQVVQASRRRAGGSWTPAINLSAGGADALGAFVAVDRVGNAVAFWERYDNRRGTAQVAALDAAGPVFAKIRIPARARPGARVRFSISPVDVWSRLAGSPRWSFGDGGSARGTSVTHSFGKVGSYTVRVTQSDVRGNRTTLARTIRIGQYDS